METEQKPSSEPINVLYVDDEQTNLFSFKASFRRDFKVFTAISGQEGIEIVEKENIHIIVSDQRMPGMTGIEMLQKIKEKHPEPIRILLTGYADITAVIDAINQGEVYRYVTKPWNTTELKTIITSANEIFELRRKNKVLTQDLIKANEKLEFLLRQNMIS
jgi:response regulator RpfG family c-di-GMP phosphodiesterase